MEWQYLKLDGYYKFTEYMDGYAGDYDYELESYLIYSETYNTINDAYNAYIEKYEYYSNFEEKNSKILNRINDNFNRKIKYGFIVDSLRTEGDL